MAVGVLILGAVLLGAAVIAAAAGGAGAGRVLAALALGVVGVVCGYLFLAGFEYPGVTPHKVVTGSLAALLGLSAVALLLWNPRP